jgi:site-specific DNA-cytosine methylase
MKILTAISLFSGAGGGSIALMQSFFNELLAIDNWPVAKKVWEANFVGERYIPLWLTDIYTVSANDILRRILISTGELTLALLSPPCQGFSTAKGKIDPLDPRNGLFLYGLDLIAGLQSKIFIIENVPGIGDPRNTAIFNEIKLRILEKLSPNYEVRLFELDSSFYRTPQARNRYFFIGYHGSLGVVPSLPTPDVISREHLRIVDIDPTITAVQVGQSKKTLKHNTKILNTVTASEQVTIYSEGTKIHMSKEQDKRFATFPEWHTIPKEIKKRDAHKLYGNTIPPAFLKAILDHILNEVGDKL